MARYKVILAYDGTHFMGFQRHGQSRTVQAELEKALSELGWSGRAILYSGRTDSGVHAAGQVAAFDLDWAHSDETLAQALNARLPADAAVLAAARERDDFHPRYDALERCYRYRLYTHTVRDPLKERFAWRVWPTVAVDRLNQAARLLQGSHDFAAFGSPPRPGGTTVRYIYAAGWTAEDGELRFRVCGNAFLYHMVRRMVYAQVQVGQDRLSLEAFEDAVTLARPLPPGLAPAQGLTLMDVRCAESRREAERLMKTLM